VRELKNILIKYEMSYKIIFQFFTNFNSTLTWNNKINQLILKKKLIKKFIDFLFSIYLRAAKERERLSSYKNVNYSFNISFILWFWY